MSSRPLLPSQVLTKISPGVSGVIPTQGLSSSPYPPHLLCTVPPWHTLGLVPVLPSEVLAVTR